MATIQKRIGKDGKTTYRVLVRRKGQPLQSMTFLTKTLAKKWAVKIEAEIDQGKAFKTSPSKQKTVGDMIDRYIENVLPAKSASSQTNQRQHLTWWKSQIGDAAYPLKLFQRVITVSLETMKIVRSLPKLDIQEPKKDKAA